MNTIKWVVSVFMALLLIGATLGILMLIASIGTFILIAAGILLCLGFLSYIIKYWWDAKTRKQ